MKILQLFALSALMIQGIYANSYDKALIEAAEMGDLNKVKSLVAKGANVNARCEHGHTILVETIRLNNPQKENYLRSKGIKFLVDYYRDGKSNLEYCIEDFSQWADISHFGYLDIVKYLVENGADINAKSDNGMTALMSAAHYGQLEVVKYLISKGANDLDAALVEAAWSGDIKMMQYLVSKGANVNAKKDSRTALMEASEMRNVEAVKYLIRKGANVNAKDSLGNSALMFASKLEIVKSLIVAGANVNDADNVGETILLRSASGGEFCGRNLKMIEYLVSVGADINAESFKDWSIHRNKGKTALMYASKHCLIIMNDTTTDKLKRSKSKDKKDKNGKDDNIVKYFLSKGLDINAKDALGATALMWHLMSSGGGCIEKVKYLVENGANVNVYDNKGKTALMYATMSATQNLEVVKYLVEMGANINAKDNDGNTALSVAKYDRIKNFLKSKGAR